MKLPKRFARPIMFLTPVAAGVAIVVLLVSIRKQPQRVGTPLPSRPVRVVQVAAQDVIPRAIGYGLVRPGKTWQAVPQVSGQIIEKHDRLVAGAAIQKGTVLLKIDPREFKLTVQEFSAAITEIDAKLSELRTKKSNTQSTLEIENRMLETNERELNRKKGLLETKSISEAAVDQEQRNYLKQLSRVHELENALRLIPEESKSLRAAKAANAARLESAQLKVEYTRIQAPFDCRITNVFFEETQFVNAGQVLLEAHGVATAEVHAHLPMDKFRNLLLGDRSKKFVFADLASMQGLEPLGLTAMVRLRAGDFTAQWDARVDRVGSVIDARTRTINVVVAVEHPYEKVQPGVRPPLIQGMFCEVEFRGTAKPGKILIPRTALHGGEVYVAEQGRLRRRAVEVGFPIRDFVVLNAGLNDGDLLVVSDVVPAIEGMLVNGQRDEELQRTLAAVARGEGDIR